MENLEELFLDELKDLYDAEKQLVKALPKVAEAASDAKLKKAIEDHLKETEGHVANLEKAFEALDEPAKGKTCKAMKGLLQEASDLLEEDAEPEVLDAALIAAAQKVEHYEISAYGSLSTWGKHLGKAEVVKLLKLNLSQEKAADEKLTKLAESGVNQKVA